MFEDLQKIKKDIKINDIITTDIIEGLQIYIKVQGEKLAFKNKELVYMNDMIYEKSKLLLKAEKEIKQVKENINCSVELLKEAKEEISRLRNIVDDYHRKI